MIYPRGGVYVRMCALCDEVPARGWGSTYVPEVEEKRMCRHRRVDERVEGKDATVRLFFVLCVLVESYPPPDSTV